MIGTFFTKEDIYIKKSQYLVLSIFVIAFSLRLFAAVSNPMLGSWDEVFHAVVAKNMAENFFEPALYQDPVFSYDKMDWRSNYIWLHKPPMMLWLMAISIKFFGAFSWAARLPSVLLSSFAVLLLYGIFSNLFTRKVGLSVSILATFNSYLISLIAGRNPTDHIDTGLFFWIILTIFFVVKLHKTQKTIWNLPIGVSMGCAYLTKAIVGLFPLLLLVLILPDLKLKKSLYSMALTGLFFLIVAAPWNMYAYHTWPEIFQYETEYNFKHITEVIEGHSESWYYFFSPKFFDDYYVRGGPFFIIIYIGMSYLLYLASRKKANWSEVFIMLWLLIPLLIFSLFRTKMISYPLFTIPAGLGIMVLMIGRFSTFAKEKIKQRNKIMQTLIILALIFLWLIPLRIVSYELRRQFSGLYASPSSNLNIYNHEDLLNQIEELKGIAEPKVIVNVKSPYHLFVMFKTGSPTYSFLPCEREIVDLINKGYHILIINGNRAEHSHQAVSIISVKLRE